jgi:hypothetical protein
MMKSQTNKEPPKTSKPAPDKVPDKLQRRPKRKKRITHQKEKEKTP